MSIAPTVPQGKEDAFGLPEIPTLAGVLDALDEAPALSSSRRADLRSAVITVTKVLGYPPESIPAQLDTLRRQLAAVPPAAHGMGRARWNNVRSGFAAALRLAGFELLPGRSPVPLDPEWRRLHGLLTTKPLRTGLSRLVHFCSTNTIAPTAVNDEVISRFEVMLLERSLVRRAEIAIKRAIVCWNQACLAVPDWPQQPLTERRFRQTYVLPLANFTTSFQADAKAWLAHLGNSDPFAERSFRALRPSSLATREFNLRQLASALVIQGRGIETITTLADLVEVEAAKMTLRFFLRRSGDKPTSQSTILAGVLLSLARHWVRVPEDHERRLRALAQRCRPTQQGMTSKNRALLRQLEDPRTIEKLVNLPLRLIDGLSHRVRLSQQEARRVELALAIELLLVAPMRRQNLARLDLHRHLVRVGHGKRTALHLHISAEEVKNEVDLEFPLPASTRRLLDFYLKSARPLLAHPDNSFLFVGQDGRGARNEVALGTTLRCLLTRELGLPITPHQFRHIAGYLFLRAQPHAHEAVRALLGHKSIETTVRFYAGMEGIAAARAYDAAVLANRHG